MEKFLINNIPATIKSSTATITAKASLSINKMLLEFNGTELEDFNKGIINEEIRTPENTAYFKGLMLEVLIEQGLIEEVI
jgi:hypothetical protein